MDSKQKPPKDVEVAAELERLASKLDSGASYDSIQEDLDAALGISETEEHPEDDADWEEDYRHRGEYTPKLGVTSEKD